MSKSQLFYMFLGVWAVLYGVSVFVPERVLVVLSGISAVIAGVLAFSFVLQ